MDLEGLDEWWLDTSSSDSDDVNDEIDIIGESPTDSTTSESSESTVEISPDTDSSDTGQEIVPSNLKKKYGVKSVRIPRARNSWRSRTVQVLDLPCARASKQVLRQGTKAVREIRKLQKTGEFLIPRKSFATFVKQLCQNIGVTSIFGREALEALQEASEMLAVEIFDLSNQIAANSGHVTVLAKDFALASKTICKTQ